MSSAAGKAKNVMTHHNNPSICRHVGITWTMEDGTKGTLCSQCMTWLYHKPVYDFIDCKIAAPPPTHYLRRTSKTVGPKGQPHWFQAEWKPLAPDSFHAAELLIREWNVRAEVDDIDIQYQLPLYCHRCFTSGLNETFAGNVCSECKGKPMICTRCSRYTSKPKQFNGGGALCNECYSNSVNFAVKKAKQNGVDMTPFKMKPVTVTRVNGDFWPIPQDNSPVGAKQWGYQGTGKTPYIITQYATKRDGATTIDGWACSCANFTRNTPRDHCKHIVKVMTSEGIVPAIKGIKSTDTKALGAMAGLSDAQVAAFRQWQRAQAENKPVKASDEVHLSDSIMSSGRKFR